MLNILAMIIVNFSPISRMVTKLLSVKVVQIVQYGSGGKFFTRNFTSINFSLLNGRRMRSSKLSMGVWRSATINRHPVAHQRSAVKNIAPKGHSVPQIIIFYNYIRNSTLLNTVQWPH